VGFGQITSAATRWRAQSKEASEHGCYGYSFRFEGAWAQKWAQSALLRVFPIALAYSKLLILNGS
jgi:hypothetical protein